MVLVWLFEITQNKPSLSTIHNILQLKISVMSSLNFIFSKQIQLHLFTGHDFYSFKVIFVTVHHPLPQQTLTFRNCSKYCTWMNSLTSHTIPLRQAACCLSFTHEDSWVKGKLGKLPKVTQLEIANLGVNPDSLARVCDANHYELLLNHHTKYWCIIYYQYWFSKSVILAMLVA